MTKEAGRIAYATGCSQAEPEDVSALRASPPCAELAALRSLPFASAFTAASFRMGWPEGGLVIRATPDLAIVCTGDFYNLAAARFSGWDARNCHYCPRAGWADWVALARRILEADAIAIEAGTAGTENTGPARKGESAAIAQSGGQSCQEG